MVPYSRDLADQRRKYGDSMLRRGDEHLATQRQFEAEAQAKLDAARQKRQEEKERLEILEASATFLMSITFFTCYHCSVNEWRS
jgi:RNA polymerase-associated protein CTR9